MEFVLDGTAHELDAETVRTVLGGSSPEEVRTHWVEVDGVRWPPKQALALATGLDRAAFTSHRALGVLERLGFATSQWGGARPETRTTRRARPAPGESRAADVVLVGCSGSKAPTARPARELFTGTAFRKARDRAEEAGLPWYVLSARHGLLRPDRVIEPYDAYLPDEPPGVRAAWGRRVVAQLAERHALRDLVLEAHAGAGYCDPLTGPLAEIGAVLVQPLAGLRQGERLAWYGQGAPAHPAPDVAPTDVRALDVTPPDVAVLLGRRAAVTPAAFLAAGRAAAKDPGLYTWWADGAGAADLGAGLGHRLDPGLVYAGRAGGVRPSGVRSANTLWGRIATMHLGGRRQFSTFRTTLSACLSPLGGPAVDGQELTAWMHRHLRVAILPLAAEEVLPGEERLLELADPPLNLRDVARTDLRRELTRRRSALPA